MFFGDIKPTSRTLTDHGLLRAPAVIMRAGVLEYDAAELGVGPRGKMLRIFRTLDSVRDPKTLASIRGAPITIGHPEKGVTPKNWRDESVGSVAGEPRVDAKGDVSADLLIGDASAIKAVNDDKREVSVGYDFKFKPTQRAGADYETVGPIITNHFALVEEGRAGHRVRVADTGQPLNGPSGSATVAGEDGGDMTKEEIEALVKGAADSAAAAAVKAGSTDAASLSAAFATALTPVVTQVQALSEQHAQAADAAKAAKAADDAKKAADELVKETEDRVRTEERTRSAVLADAARILSADEVAKLQNASVKDILVAAVGDSVPNASALSEDTLRGVLMATARTADASGPELAPGVVRTADAPNPAPGTPQSAQGVRDGAYKKYVDRLKTGYMDGTMKPEEEGMDAGGGRRRRMRTGMVGS